MFGIRIAYRNGVRASLLSDIQRSQNFIDTLKGKQDRDEQEENALHKELGVLRRLLNIRDFFEIFLTVVNLLLVKLNSEPFLIASHGLSCRECVVCFFQLFTVLSHLRVAHMVNATDTLDVMVDYINLVRVFAALNQGCYMYAVLLELLQDIHLLKAGHPVVQVMKQQPQVLDESAGETLLSSVNECILSNTNTTSIGDRFEFSFSTRLSHLFEWIMLRLVYM